MLSKASAIFKGLTMDSFNRLLVDTEGDTPRLFGIRPDGEQVNVTGMSEGSRDQLYLALRLAALESRGLIARARDAGERPREVAKALPP